MNDMYKWVLKEAIRIAVPSLEGNVSRTRDRIIREIENLRGKKIPVFKARIWGVEIRPMVKVKDEHIDKAISIVRNLDVIDVAQMVGKLEIIRKG